MRSKIALTIGDAAGIGPEISVKIAVDKEIMELMDVVLVGPESVISEAAKKYVPSVGLSKAGERNVQTCIIYEDFDTLSFNGDLYAGKSTAEAGKASYEGVVLATNSVIGEKYDAIVTAPVSKESVNLSGQAFQGHTELVAELSGVDNFCMMQSDGPLRVAFAYLSYTFNES